VEKVVKDGVTNPVKQILAISPATDLRNVNAGIGEADKKDPVLSVGLTTDVGEYMVSFLSLAMSRALLIVLPPTIGQKWAGSWGVGHQEVSPNLSPNISALKAAGVKVHGVVGTADVLAPDALVFKDLCAKHGVQGEWLVWKGGQSWSAIVWMC
jgi:acetyl esterase/lipase